MNKREWLIPGIAAVLLSSFFGVLACQAAFSLCDPEYTEVIGQDCHYTSSILLLFIITFIVTLPFVFAAFRVALFLLSLIRLLILKLITTSDI